MNYQKMDFKELVKRIKEDIKYFENQGWGANEIMQQIDEEYSYQQNTVAIVRAFEDCGYKVG